MGGLNLYSDYGPGKIPDFILSNVAPLPAVLPRYHLIHQAQRKPTSTYNAHIKQCYILS